MRWYQIKVLRQLSLIQKVADRKDPAEIVEYFFFWDGKEGSRTVREFSQKLRARRFEVADNAGTMAHTSRELLVELYIFQKR